MMTKQAGCWIAAAVVAALAIGAARAEDAPAEPFQPGAAADAAAPDAAKDAKPAAPKHRARLAKRRAPERGGALTIVVQNKRSVGLVELKVGPSGGEAKKIAGPLAFGRKTTARLPRAKDCLYDIHGHFADDADTDQVGVDLCKDKAINLTDE